MISFIFFDVGGVVIRDISDDENWKLFTKFLGVTDNLYVDFNNFWESYEPQLNVSIPVDELIPLIKSKFNLNLPENFSLQEEFVKRFKKNESVWPIIEKVKKQSRIGLLTNMYPGMLSAINKSNIMPNVNWDVVVDSSIVGFQKPDQKMYEVAQKMSGANNSEILFIDNSRRNIEAADKFGWQTFLYDQLNITEANSKLIGFLNDSLH